jgi:hypothetical protein
MATVLKVTCRCREHEGGWVAFICVNGKPFGNRNGFGVTRKDAINALLYRLVFPD